MPKNFFAKLDHCGGLSPTNRAPLHPVPTQGGWLAACLPLGTRVSSAHPPPPATPNSGLFLQTRPDVIGAPTMPQETCSPCRRRARPGLAWMDGQNACMIDTHTLFDLLDMTDERCVAHTLWASHGSMGTFGARTAPHAKVQPCHACTRMHHVSRLMRPRANLVPNIASVGRHDDCVSPSIATLAGKAWMLFFAS
jgi:hypothetical protein